MTSRPSAVQAALRAVGVLLLACSLGAGQEPVAAAAGKIVATLAAPAAARVTRAAAPLLPAYVRPEPSAAWKHDEHDPTLEASRCRAVLLEVIQRAAHDWVLYRTHSKLSWHEVAVEAYIWLFEERPGHRWWEEREANGKTMMSFLAICDTLDLDPEKVRARVRSMTPKEILTSGRPAERRSKAPDELNVTEHGVELVSLSALEENTEQYSSSYEAHYAVYTSD